MKTAIRPRPTRSLFMLITLLVILVMTASCQIYATGNAGATTTANTAAAPSSPVATTSPATTAEPTASPTLSPTPTITVTPVPTATAATAALGQDAMPDIHTDWSASFPGHFTDGAIEQTASTYRNDQVCITLDRKSAGEVTYYVADIFIRDIQCFRTAFANGKYGGGIDEVPEMANDNGAILAINGDYCTAHSSGVVIRNGKVYRKSLFDDVLVLYGDGRMATFTRSQFDLSETLEAGAWQAWTFGPMLLDDGQPMTRFNSNVTPLNPRTAVGYYEPGHYCFVVVDGRQPGYSIGMTMTQLSRLMYDLGCKVAYNLDGGQTSVMTYLGEVANQPYRGGRRSSDILYIAP